MASRRSGTDGREDEGRSQGREAEGGTHEGEEGRVISGGVGGSCLWANSAMVRCCDQSCCRIEYKHGDTAQEMVDTLSLAIVWG